MDAFSERVLERVDPVLAGILRDAESLSPVPFRVVAGHRGLREQNALFAAGLSVHRFPQSPHNKLPSRAVDIEPLTDPSDLADRAAVVQAIQMAAAEAGVLIFWRGESSPHLELI